MAITIQKRPYEFCFSGNPVMYELYSALAAGDDTVFFEIKVMHKKIADVSYTEVVTLPYSPLAGTAQINIQDVLQSILEYELPGFDDDETLSWEAEKQTGNFYIQFREITTANTNPSWDNSEADYARFVIKGGLDYFKYRGNNFWVNYYDDGGVLKFLTWQKSGRLASIDERMYLAFLNTTDVGTNTLRVFAKVYYTDGTNDEVQADYADKTKGVLLYIPAGASQWGLPDLDVDKNIYYWTIEIRKLNDETYDPFSEVFTYYADNRNDYNATTIHYRGSLGSLDSARVRGVIEKNLSYETEQQDRVTGADYFSGDFITPQKIIASSKELLTWKGNIGPLPKEEQDRLRDMYLKREIWWCVAKKWWPIVNVTSNFKLTDTNQTRWSIPFEWTLAYAGTEHYTPQSIELGDGIFNENVCMAFVSGITISTEFDTPGAGDCRVTIDFTENDPQDASTQIRYRIIKKDDSSVVVDWTEAPYAQIIVVLPIDDKYLLEVQSICTNNVYGTKVTAQIDTNEESEPPSGNSTITNVSSSGSDCVITVDGDEVFNNYLGAHMGSAFNAIDASGIIVIVEPVDFSPSYATLISNGITYIATIEGNQAIFNDVIIVSGIEITIY